MLASHLTACKLEDLCNTPAGVETALPAKPHALNYHSPSHEAPDEIFDPVVVSDETRAAAPKLMNARTVEQPPHTPTHLPSKLGRAAQPAKIDVSQAYIAARDIEDWLQDHLMDMADLTDMKIHHINWCGKAVFKKSTTSPAVSLCIIFAPPKKEYFDFEINLCTTVLLRNALQLIDPILFVGDFNILNDLSGTKLQNATIGVCHKFYNDRGRWSFDEWKRNEDIPLLDGMDVRHYGANDIILNGWFSRRNVPLRGDLLTHTAELAKRYHVTRKPAMEELPSDSGKGTQERVVRQPFVESPLRKVVQCSQIDDICFSATVSAGAVSKTPHVKLEAQRVLHRAQLVTALQRTTEIMRIEDVIATHQTENQTTTRDVHLTELLEEPWKLESLHDGQCGSATQASAIKRITQGLEPESDAASRKFFNSDSAGGIASDGISIGPCSPSVDNAVTTIDVQRPMLGLARKTGTGEEICSVENTNEKSSMNSLESVCLNSNEAQQQARDNLTAAVLTVDCAFVSEFDLPGLFEPRSPLPSFKRTRPSARRASWTPFRSKMRKYSSSTKSGDRRPTGLERKIKFSKDLLRRKQNVLR